MLMITCREMPELASDYLERALPLGGRVAVRLHLLRCEACRRYLDQIRKTIRLLAAAPPTRLPAAVEDRLITAARGSRTV